MRNVENTMGKNCNGDVHFVFQKLEYRNPIFTGEFHTDISVLVFDKPVFELQDRIVEGREALLL